MANLWLDLKGPILADTVYINGVLVAKDVTITLPAVTHVTADYKAMGTYTAPMTGQIEGMEAAITKIGIDKGLRSMVQLESKTLEVRLPVPGPRGVHPVHRGAPEGPAGKGSQEPHHRRHVRPGRAVHRAPSFQS